MATDFHRTMDPTEPVYLNSIGSLFGIPDIDDNAIRQQQYEAAKKAYPAGNTCSDVAAAIKSIQNNLANTSTEKVADIAKGGSGIVQQRKIDGYTRWVNELVTTSNTWRCDQYADQAAHQQYLSDFNNELDAASNLGGTPNNDVLNWVVIGGIGVSVIAALIIILKKA